MRLALSSLDHVRAPIRDRVTMPMEALALETARQLGALGYRVWLGSRDGARGEAAAGKLAAEGHDEEPSPLT